MNQEVPTCEVCRVGIDVKAIQTCQGWGRAAFWHQCLWLVCPSCRPGRWRHAHNMPARWIAPRYLSLSQPWAWLILNGWKDCENRTWQSDFTGRVLIHAAKKIDPNLDDIRVGVAKDHGIELPSNAEIKKQTGGVVGLAEFGQQALSMKSPWFTGPAAWPILNFYPLPLTPMRGFLGLWKTGDEIIRIRS